MHRLKFLVLLSSFICTAASLHGQTLPLEFLISDPDSRPLRGVTVKYGTDTVLSDEFGTALIRFNYRDTGTVVFALEGYTTLRYTPFIPAEALTAGGWTFKITLEPELRQVGDPVVVRVDDKTQAALRTQTVATVSAPQYLIRNRNPSDPSALLDQLPGVNVIDGQVNIRSGSGWSYGAGSRVALMVDNLPMLSGDAGQVQWSFLPQELIQSVDVLKGTGSVLYGSSALNGVINVRTMQPSAKPRTGVNTFYGWYDQPERESLRWSDKRLLTRGFSAWDLRRSSNGKTGYRFSFNHFNDDGYRMEEFNRRSRFQAGIKHDVNQKLHLGFEAGVMGSRSGSFLLWENHQLGYTSLDSGFNRTNSTRLHIDPHVRLRTGSITHHFNARYLSIDNRNENNDPTSGDQSNANRMLYSEYRAQRSARLAGGNMNLSGGLVWMEADTRSPLFSGKQTTANRAGYLQADWVGKWLNLSAGGRYEHYRLNKTTDSRPVFRAGFLLKPFPFAELRGSWGQGFRFPTIAETFIKTSVGPVKIYPNAGLRAETGSNAEAGIKLLLAGRNASRMFIDMAIFSMQFDNMMEFTFSQWSRDNSAANLGGFGFMSLNVGRVHVKGKEITLGGTLRTGKYSWQFLGGFTRTDPQVADPDFVYATDSLGRALSFRETSSNDTRMLKYRFRDMFRMDIQVSRRFWELGFSYRWNSAIENIDKAFVALPITLFVPGVQTGRDAGMKGAGFTDLRFAVKPNSNLRLGLIVNNIGNTEFMTRPADIRPPRSFQIQLLAEF
jgi:iron complex outermembrane receptor protein